MTLSQVLLGSINLLQFKTACINGWHNTITFNHGTQLSQLFTIATDKDAQMFALNTQYVDNNPRALQRVIQPACQAIDTLMAYHDPHYERAETILAAFAIFALPTFKETWTDTDYQTRFERMWQLIAPHI